MKNDITAIFNLGPRSCSRIATFVSLDTTDILDFQIDFENSSSKKCLVFILIIVKVLTRTYVLIKSSTDLQHADDVCGVADRRKRNAVIKCNRLSKGKNDVEEAVTAMQPYTELLTPNCVQVNTIVLYRPITHYHR